MRKTNGTQRVFNQASYIEMRKVPGHSRLERRGLKIWRRWKKNRGI